LGSKFIGASLGLESSEIFILLKPQGASQRQPKALNTTIYKAPAHARSGGDARNKGFFAPPNKRGHNVVSKEIALILLYLKKFQKNHLKTKAEKGKTLLLMSSLHFCFAFESNLFYF